MKQSKNQATKQHQKLQKARRYNRNSRAKEDPEEMLDAAQDQLQVTFKQSDYKNCLVHIC